MERICGAKKLSELHQSLIELLLTQFSGLNVWVCLRSSPSGPMEITAGKTLTTASIDRLNLAVPRSLDEVLEKQKYMLVHQLPRQIANMGIRSVIIASIVYQKDCFGVLYVENSTEHPHYSLPDLDYLMMLAMYTGLVIHKLSL
jgi:GAF domain-containing protein